MEACLLGLLLLGKGHAASHEALLLGATLLLHLRPHTLQGVLGLQLEGILSAQTPSQVSEMDCPTSSGA